MTVATGSLAARVDELRRVSTRPVLTAAPPGAVSLAMGEPDFPTPWPVVEAAARALRDGHTHYADQLGLPELRAAIADSLPGRPAHLRTAPDVLVTHGATAALAAAILATVGPAARVVIPEPAYSLYADLVTLAGGVVDFVPLDEEKHWDLDRIADALPGARLVIFSNPSNPTGIVHGEAELDALGQLLTGTDTLVISDEAYHRIVYPGHEFRSALEIESLRDRVVYVQTFSKTYAMTGWRIGYLAGPSAVVSAAAQVHRTTNGSLNTAVQLGALQALDLPSEAIEPMLASYEKRRNLVTTALGSVPGVDLVRPEGTFYAFLRYRDGVPSSQVVSDLAERGVVVRAGGEYGPSGEGHIRISFATSAEALHTGLDILADYFTNHSRERSEGLRGSCAWEETS